MPFSVNQVRPDMILNHLRHQPRYRTTNTGNKLHHRLTPRLTVKRMLNRVVSQFEISVAAFL